MLFFYNKIIPTTHKIEFALTILYGININQSQKICKNVGINPQMRVRELKNYHVNRIIKYINKNLVIESVLKKKKKDQLNTLLNMKLVRGIRQTQGLPVRGQRTHTNAQTCQKFKKKSNLSKTNYNKKQFNKKPKKK